MQSKALAFVEYQGLTHKLSGEEQCAVERCPHCSNTNYKLYVNVGGGDKDGLYDCKVCGASGNLYQLRSMYGEVSSAKGPAGGGSSNLTERANTWHHNLLDSEAYADVLDYAIAERKFTMGVIKRFKLGAATFRRDDTNYKCLVYPYWEGEQCVFYKGRSLPPDREFFAYKGSLPLYNVNALTPGMEYIVAVEGEANVVALASIGVDNVIGIPGAGTKKAEWIQLLEEAKPKKVYLLYDNDAAGQKGAKDIAGRIALETICNVLLPEDKGKDPNEWVVSGGDLEQFHALLQTSKPIEVQGVQSIITVLDELVIDFEQKGNPLPEFTTPYPRVNGFIGGYERGDLVVILAPAKVGKTTFAMNLAQHWVEQGYNVYDLCLEMSTKRKARKWASMVTRTDDTPGRSEMSADVVRAAREYAKGMKGEYLFGHTLERDRKVVIPQLKQAIRRYGADVAIFDNLQHLIQSMEHLAQETNITTKMFKEIPMELNMLMVLIVQPRGLKEGQIATIKDAYGSSLIQSDVDGALVLHRNSINGSMREKDFTGFMEVEQYLDSNLLVKAEATRYAPGGTTTLFIDGARSLIREISEAEHTTQQEEMEEAVI